MRLWHESPLRALRECAWRALAALCLWGALVSCAAPATHYPYAKEPDPRRFEYVIGVPDALRIRVWRNTEFNSDVQVRPDGTITLPLIGDVPAATRTPSELRKDIASRLSAYVRLDATAVMVEIAQIRSYRVTVTGNVARPGVLDSGRYLSVGEAIALAGGPNQYADTDEAVIVRTRSDGRVTRIPIRYDLIMQGKAPEQDILLLRGDLVHMP